jgi:hypothetical protein
MGIAASERGSQTAVRVPYLKILLRDTEALPLLLGRVVAE